MPISHLNRPKIIITMGDPSGIGPEVALKALASPRLKGLADFLLIGDAFVIGRIKNRYGLRLTVPVLDMSNVPAHAFRDGAERPVFGKAAIEYLNKALEIVEAGEAGAIVTGPINKSSVRAAGHSGFEGHTEYLAEKTKSGDFAMMFVGGALKITLVTRHIALKDVARSISAEKICRVIALTRKYLSSYFGIKRPRIGVAGLNPHAGEGGSFGREEIDIIAPAVRTASGGSGRIFGPLPPDVIFHDALNKKFDAVVAMYHDQALIPFKMLHFKDGVNVTLGLPFVRTSPDHGTAFDIAGRGVADPSSMIEAVALACRLSPKSADR